MSVAAEQAPAAAPSLSSVPERLKAVLGTSRKLVVALAACSIVSGFLEACLLALVAQIASTAVKGGSKVHEHLGPVHVHASVKTLFELAFAIALTRLVLQFPMAFLPARIAARVQGSLRRQLFGAYSRASWPRQAEDREGHLQEIMTSQVLQATGGALQATQIVIAGFQFLVLMASAIVLNAVAAGVVFGAAVVLFAALRPLNRLGARRARELSRAQLSYAGGVSEANRLAQETQVFGVAAAQRARLNVFISAAQDLFYRAQFVLRLTPNLYQGIIYLILLGGLAALYASGRSHFVGLGAAVLVILRAGTYGQVVQAAYQALRQSLPFIERLQDNIQRYNESIPRDRGEPLPEVIETLAFDHVTFAYRPGQPVLKDLAFQVDAGEAIGVIGPSGAGKSTLIQLLLRLRSPDEGAFLVNGIDARQFARADWQRRVAYVPQEPRLIHASVTENIRYFRDIDDDEIERAAMLARIHEDVVSWEKGYDTIVGPRADAVSGGQQQRICLARALAGHPEVLVLDEPTSALDPHSESLIQESLIGLREELTLFVIAHRMSTLDVCDRVMVIVDGRLVAFDTTVLLQQSNTYYRSASTLAAGGVLP